MLITGRAGWTWEIHPRVYTLARHLTIFQWRIRAHTQVYTHAHTQCFQILACWPLWTNCMQQASGSALSAQIGEARKHCHFENAAAPPFLPADLPATFLPLDPHHPRIVDSLWPPPGQIWSPHFTATHLNEEAVRRPRRAAPQRGEEAKGGQDPNFRFTVSDFRSTAPKSHSELGEKEKSQNFCTYGWKNEPGLPGIVV